MLRILIFLVIIYLIAKVIKKLVKSSLQTTRPKDDRVIDQMVACPRCGTYNPSQRAHSYKGLYFCDRQCLKAYQKETT